MAASTVEELADDLDESVQWRRTELLAIRNEITKANGPAESSPLGRGLLRSGVALLYAHWEGFCKEALQGYLDFVAKRKLKYGDLNDQLATTALMRLLGSAAQGDPSSLAKVLEIARRGPVVRARLPREHIINLRSNLRHEVLSEVLELLGLDATAFATKAHLIDYRLCDQRNAIAHGRASFPTKDDFTSLHAEVISMIEVVRDLVINAAATKAYRMSVPGEVAP